MLEKQKKEKEMQVGIRKDRGREVDRNKDKKIERQKVNRGVVHEVYVKFTQLYPKSFIWRVIIKGI